MLTPKRQLRLRYFTPSAAEEFYIPYEELRVRDPQSGELIAGLDKASFSTIDIIKIDYKGNYGISLQWSDGHFADIFSYYSLKLIVDKLKFSEV